MTRSLSSPLPVPSSRPARRRGSILAVVGGLIVLVAMGVFMLNRAIRQQYLDAHRYEWGEVAAYLAESGLNQAMERLSESAVTPGTEYYLLLLESPAEEINELSVPVEDSPYLEQLLGLFGGAAELEVSVAFKDFRPLLPDRGLRGIRADPREKVGELALVSRATYRGATRTLVAAKQVRVVSVTAPVLSKFTLFLRERPDQPLNSLEYDRLTPAAGFTREGEPARPLVLYHRQERIPAIVDGRFDPLAEVLSGYRPDEAGLVFLGGRDPWILNLTHGYGAGPYEELFHLRRSRYLFESALPDSAWETGLTFGLYRGIMRSEKFGSAASPAGQYLRPSTGRPASEGTAVLHLYGDVSHVTPTVVLGSVFRSYVALRLVDGLWFPTMTPAEFAARPDRMAFGNDYRTYARVMTHLAEEPYNRSFDYIATNRERLRDDRTVEANGTPFEPGPVLAGLDLERIGPAVEGDMGYLYPRPGGEGRGLCRLDRVDAAGNRTPVFRGALQDVDGALLEKVIMAKVVYRVRDSRVFRRRFLRHATLRVPGVVLVEEGDLELGGVNIGMGAMIVARGDITIPDRIVQDRPGNPLTLVSLEGDIRVETSEKVDAHLVALSGRVSSSGGLNLVGGVAARTLDLASLTRGETRKRITYDQGLDPTDERTSYRNLRVVMDKRIRMYMEGH